jgi:hypothetical protein
MKLMMTLKRRGELMDAEMPERGTRTPSERRGHGGISVPFAAWRAPRREQGGIPFGGPSQIARLAAAMVEAKVTGCEPPTVPDGMSSGDVTTAVRIVETLMERTAMIDARMLTLKE